MNASMNTGSAMCRWRTSTRSQSSNCVEVATLAGPSGTAVAMRDSKDRRGGTLVFDRRPWVEFLAAAKAGEFDGP